MTFFVNIPHCETRLMTVDDEIDPVLQYGLSLHADDIATTTAEQYSQKLHSQFGIISFKSLKHDLWN